MSEMFKPRRNEGREEDRGLRIEDRFIGRKATLDLLSSILDLHLATFFN
jgi:hypothetical protein